MNKHIITAVGSALLGGGVLFGAVQAPAPNPIILADNVELHSRLKEPPVWDTSVATSKEVTDAYIAVASKYGVTAKDIANSGGNLQVAIQVKLQAANLMCKI